MIPSGPPNPGGSHNVNPVLLRSNSGILVQGSQGGNLPSQTQFSSMVSTHNQFGNGVNMGLLANMANMSSLLNQPFSNGGQLSGVGLSADHINLQQRGGSGNTMDIVAAVDSGHLSYNSSGQGCVQNFSNPSMGQIMPENPQAQQGDAPSNFQQQFSAAHSQQQLRNAIGNIATVKSEPQMGAHDRNGPQQQLPSFRNLGAVKLEPQQLQSLRSLASVKLEPQQDSDPSLFLQQQQQQQLLQTSRQPSPSAMQASLMQQQQQQQQQQQLLKTIPQQRPQLPHQLQQQALSLRPQVKSYEPGTCARRLTHYMYNQRHRPADNNIEFWRKFVNEYFAPHAKKRWCVSLYGSGRQTTGVFPQDVWHCEICNRKPGRGFETTVEVLPRLCKIKYDSGTLEEILYVDMPREYQNSSGQIVLDYAKAIQESVFEQLRVVRDGHLRIVFNSDLKICSWEFCARRHEELIPRRLIVPQVSQLGAVAEKYQSASQNAASNSNLPAQELQNTCNSFVVRARQMARALEVPLVNDLGYTKRYVRCLQISEVVNSMKDLIDYSRETGDGPMASLANFPRRTSASSSLHGPASQQSNQQQPNVQAANQNDPNVSQISTVQLTCNGVASVNSSLNAACSSTSSSTIAGLLHQNSMNSRHESTVGNMNNSSGSGNTGQIPSAGSSSSLPPQNQVNPSLPFTCNTPPASSNNPPLTSQSTSIANTVNSTGNISSMQQSTGEANEVDQIHSQASMQQIMRKMMISGQIPGVGSYGNETKVINGITPTLNGGNHFMGSGIAGNPIVMDEQGFGNLGGMGNAATASGIRAAMINNAMALGGRGGFGQMALDLSSLNSQQQQQQQDFGNGLINIGLGRVNSFNNIQFDWKTTP